MILRSAVFRSCVGPRFLMMFHSSVSEALNQLVANGTLKPDIAQQRVARRLSKLQEALAEYDNRSLVDFFAERAAILEKLEQQRQARGGEPTRDQEQSPKVGEGQQHQEEFQSPAVVSAPPDVIVPRGLYIYGSVGTGKSMLMDTFYVSLPTSKKRRVHFHAFLQEVHQRIHSLKQQDLAERGRNFHVDTSEQNNPIVRVAKALSAEVCVLCFDEFQVTDVADALIVKQLFTTLFQHGTVVVATSNRPPADLYEGGINRSYFLPFIGLLEYHCIVHKLESELDYRRILSKDMETFFLVGSKGREMDEMYRKLFNGETEIETKLSVSFQRSMLVSRAHPNDVVARFTFDELCRRDVGAADYRAVAQKFRIILVEDIPRLSLKQHNEARRFITLIDELYENGCALMCSAERPTEDLLVDSHEEHIQKPEQIETKIGEAFGIDVAQSSGKAVGALASVRELSFAFDRAASRLREMCSRRWWDQALSK